MQQIIWQEIYMLQLLQWKEYYKFEIHYNFLQRSVYE